MSFKKMKSALDKNTSMDEKRTIEIKSVMRSYRIRIDLAEILNRSEMNKNKFVNEMIEKGLKEKGLL